MHEDTLRRIDEKLDGISTRIGKLESNVAVTNSMMENRARNIEDLQVAVYGDRDGEPGLKIAVDRLRTSEENRNKWFWTLASLVMGLIVDFFHRLVVK